MRCLRDMRWQIPVRLARRPGGRAWGELLTDSTGELGPQINSAGSDGAFTMSQVAFFALCP